MSQEEEGKRKLSAWNVMEWSTIGVEIVILFHHRQTQTINHLSKTLEANFDLIRI